MLVLFVSCWISDDFSAVTLSPRLLILSGNFEILYRVGISSAESNNFLLDASILGLRLGERAVGNLKSEVNDADAVLVTIGELGTLACETLAELRLRAFGRSDCCSKRGSACVGGDEGLSTDKNFVLRELGEA